MMTPADVRDLLKQRVSEFGTQEEYAAHIGLSHGRISQMLSGYAGLSKKAIADLKLEKVISYRFKNSACKSAQSE